MSPENTKFTGQWLHHGEWQGKEFSHEMAEYHHDESPGAQGETPMRHTVIERNGSKVGVWIPSSWTDEQARTALETNW